MFRIKYLSSRVLFGAASLSVAFFFAQLTLAACNQPGAHAEWKSRYDNETSSDLTHASVREGQNQTFALRLQNGSSARSWSTTASASAFSVRSFYYLSQRSTSSSASSDIRFASNSTDRHSFGGNYLVGGTAQTINCYSANTFLNAQPSSSVGYGGYYQLGSFSWTPTSTQLGWHGQTYYTKYSDGTQSYEYPANPGCGSPTTNCAGSPSAFSYAAYTSPGVYGTSTNFPLITRVPAYNGYAAGTNSATYYYKQGSTTNSFYFTGLALPTTQVSGSFTPSPITANSTVTLPSSALNQSVTVTSTSSAGTSPRRFYFKYKKNGAASYTEDINSNNGTTTTYSLGSKPTASGTNVSWTFSDVDPNDNIEFCTQIKDQPGNISQWKCIAITFNPPINYGLTISKTESGSDGVSHTWSYDVYKCTTSACTAFSPTTAIANPSITITAAGTTGSTNVDLNSYGAAYYRVREINSPMPTGWTVDAASQSRNITSLTPYPTVSFTNTYTAPPTCSISASPSSITAGGTSILTYTSSASATSGSLASNPTGRTTGYSWVSGSNRTWTTPGLPTTTTYTLTVSNASGSGNCSATVTVTASPTCSFNSTTYNVASGLTTTISYTTNAAATSGSLSSSPAGYTAGFSFSSGSGSYVTPSLGSDTTVYTLTVNNGAGGTSTCQATVVLVYTLNISKNETGTDGLAHTWEYTVRECTDVNCTAYIPAAGTPINGSSPTTSIFITEPGTNNSATFSMTPYGSGYYQIMENVPLAWSSSNATQRFTLTSASRIANLSFSNSVLENHSLTVKAIKRVGGVDTPINAPVSFDTCGTCNGISSGAATTDFTIPVSPAIKTSSFTETLTPQHSITIGSDTYTFGSWGNLSGGSMILGIGDQADVTTQNGGTQITAIYILNPILSCFITLDKDRIDVGEDVSAIVPTGASYNIPGHTVNWYIEWETGVNSSTNPALPVAYQYTMPGNKFVRIYAEVVKNSDGSIVIANGPCGTDANVLVRQKTDDSGGEIAP